MKLYIEFGIDIEQEITKEWLIKELIDYYGGIEGIPTTEYLPFEVCDQLARQFVYDTSPNFECAVQTLGSIPTSEIVNIDFDDIACAIYDLHRKIYRPKW